MKIYKKAILPVSFRANGVSCGIKKSGKLDLALFYSDLPAKASCRFTSNSIAAAPIEVDKRYLGAGRSFRAIIVNSGNANCFTGPAGTRDTEETLKALSGALGIGKGRDLAASTGIIARRLPVKKIIKALPQLISGLSHKGIDKAKKAIMTTDTFAKEITVRIKMGRDDITICGVAKGAGMIAPNLATMLAFIFTDANITRRALDKALKFSVGKSFNCITVDGCMSTNDSVMALANAAAGNRMIDGGRDFNLFTEALGVVCRELAKLIVRDAEGASKFIRIDVNKAATFQEARAIALSVANSSLFKTAAYGENPNFGRIVAAIGATGIKVRQKELKIAVSPLKKKDIYVKVWLNRGKSSATVYTSDLTPEYIKINAEYN